MIILPQFSRHCCNNFYHNPCGHFAAALTILPLSSRHCWRLGSWQWRFYGIFPLFSKFIRILCFVPEDCWHFTHAQFRCNFRLTIQDQLVLVSPLKWCLRGERVVADLEQKAEVSTQQPESRRLRVLTGLATEITIGLCHRRARDPPL